LMLIKLHIFMLNEGNLHSTRYSQFSLVDVKTFIVCDFIFLSKEKIDIDWIEYKKPTKNRYWDMNCTINMFDFILYSIILYLILSYICIKAQKCGVLDMRKHFVQIILVKCNQQCKKKKQWKQQRATPRSITKWFVERIVGWCSQNDLCFRCANSNFNLDLKY
jgi:hypothetical protein